MTIKTIEVRIVECNGESCQSSLTVFPDNSIAEAMEDAGWYWKRDADSIYLVDFCPEHKKDGESSTDETLP